MTATDRATATALSFCIPTFNRSSTVQALVRRVLQCDDPDIEVVVLDNGSTDDTVSRLASIDDPRLSVHTNGSNRGVIFNILHVLLRARGDYCCLLLDKDSVDPVGITAFKSFLLNERPATGFCEYGPATDRVADLFEAGLPALRKVGYACHHPSGYFFEAQRLRGLDIATRFSDFDYVGHFPLDFMQAELSLQGRAAVYHRDLFSPEQLTATAKKSFGTHAGKEDAFFSPKGRLKMATNFSRHIARLPITGGQKRTLITDRYLQGVITSTLGYRRLLANELICNHYHIATRRVGLKETLSHAVAFHKGFMLGLVSDDPAHEVSLSTTMIGLAFTRRAIGALARRLTRARA